MITTNAVRRRQRKAEAKAARRHPLKPAPIPPHHHACVSLKAERITKDEKTLDVVTVGYACLFCTDLFTPRFTLSYSHVDQRGRPVEPGTTGRRSKSHLRRVMARQRLAAAVRHAQDEAAAA